MGTDVHAVWQAKKDGKWVDVPSTWEQDRDYFLFAWLANVRNGFGFAGVKSHSAVEPVAMPRGLPDDFILDGEAHPTSIENINPKSLKWLEEEEKANPSVWMGDHSFSWLTADEMLSAKVPGGFWCTGVLSKEYFRTWNGVSVPDYYSGDVWGRDVVIAQSPVEVDERSTHVRVFWRKPEGKLDYFLDEVRRLKAEHGEVRLVFGFDS